MVEQDTSAGDEPEQTSNKSTTGPQESSHRGETSISTGEVHSQSMHHHLSSGRHSPHIPPPLHIPASVNSFRSRSVGSSFRSLRGAPTLLKKHSSRPQSPSPLDWAEAGKVYTQQYLPPDHQPTYMMSPHQPNPAKVPDFNVPRDGQGVKIKIPRHRRGMDILRDACIAQMQENIAYAGSNVGARPRSPHMNNEEPIALSTYPDARPTNEIPKIERDDFPAPPYIYADPERRRRYSESSSRSRKSEDTDEDDDVILDPTKSAELAKEKARIRREAEELKKISSGIGKVFLHNIEERAKIRQDRFRAGIDPRNASRTASANREPLAPPRYGSPAFASPSRLDDRPRPWEEWDFTPPPQLKWRSASSGASTLPSYSIPRPGYGLSTATTPKSSTMPQVGRASPGLPELIFDDGTFVSDDMHRTQSGEFASTTIPDYAFDRTRIADVMLVRSKIVEPYYQCDFLEPMEKVVPVMRKDRPIYPVQRLLVTNRRLPDDVDRNHLELHLTTEDFIRIFQMSREAFYHMPEWKRNELKKRMKLF